MTNQVPDLLYKYLSSDMIEKVLKDRTFKFTCPSETNDLLEIRSIITLPTFNKVFSERKKPFKQITEKILLASDKKQYKKLMRSFFNDLKKQYDNKKISELCKEGMMQNLFFSMSENWDISVMWGHYSENARGFALALKTKNDFFKIRNYALHKVIYSNNIDFDILKDPSKVISKTSDWSYEREWRLYAPKISIPKNQASNLHLMNFDFSIIDHVIVGNRCSQGDIDKIKEIIRVVNFQINLYKLRPNPITGQLEKERI